MLLLWLQFCRKPLIRKAYFPLPSQGFSSVCGEPGSEWHSNFPCAARFETSSHHHQCSPDINDFGYKENIWLTFCWKQSWLMLCSLCSEWVWVGGKLEKLTCWMLPSGSIRLGWEACCPLHTHCLTNQSSLWRFRGVLHPIPSAAALADWLCLCYAQQCQQTANIFFGGGRKGWWWGVMQIEEKKRKKIKIWWFLILPIQLNLGKNFWDGVAWLCSAPLLSSACCKQGCKKYSRKNHENPSSILHILWGYKSLLTLSIID